MLGDTEKTAEELSAQADIPAPALSDCCALSYAVCSRKTPTDDSSTRSIRYLRSDVNPSLREMSLILNDDAVLRGWQHLEQVLMTGNPAFAAANGQTFFSTLPRIKNAARTWRAL